MTKSQYCLVPVFFFILSCFHPQLGQCKKQAQALDEIYKVKRKGSSNFGIEENHHVNYKVKIHPQKGLKEKDRIERLPGQPKVEFHQYGGYVTVNKSSGRALYYYFVEAKHSNKESSPLLLWLNGGPGCSSLGFGAMQELGPFRVHSDGKTLFRNRYSWNNAANVLFLESPVGVGFSYSNTTSDYKKMGDGATAADNYVFLVNWLERFPEYNGREFYITGESYAGHFVPQLAHTILYHNKKANNTIINLKGIMIGNADINDETDWKGKYDYFEGHALISDETLHDIYKYCDLSPNATTESDECSTARFEATKNTLYLDVYNIYGPLCSNSSLTAKPKKTSLMNFDPCMDDYVLAYLNRPDVQQALHANVTKLSYYWEPCSNVLGLWQDSSSTSIPLLQEIMANGLRVWIFSGDTDGVITVTSTKYSINTMKLPVKTPWHPWYLGGELGGYTQVYEGDLTFATVRGAGHQVPTHQPKRALSLIYHFLDGSPLPDTSRYI